jgi:formylglycine-generating enzyme required for sulfatase activity
LGVVSSVSALVVLSALIAGCKKGEGDGAAAGAAPNASPTLHAAMVPGPTDAGAMIGAAAALETHAAKAETLRARSAAKAGETIDVPARSFPSGSTPGDEARDPTLEPVNVPVSLVAFSIDALPYPNDPQLPPKTGVSRGEAARLCGERSARLCTELEWESACKGQDLDLYPTGDGWDTACEKDSSSCASGYGVRAMGVLREWTQSQVTSAIEGASSFAAVRGAGAPAADAGPPSHGVHRCARRTRASESRSASDLGFRCCSGATNAAVVAPIASVPAFRPTKLDTAQLAKIFLGIPELASLKDIRLYDEAYLHDMREKVNPGIHLVTQVLWSPESGAELLVATGRSKSMSFIVALYPLEGEKYRLASYFLMLGDVEPIALAFEPFRRQDLLWSSCWGCAGEQGSIRVRDDHHVVIVQH